MRNSKSIAELIEQGNDPLKYVGMWCDNRHPSADRTPAVVLGGLVRGSTEDLCLMSHPDLNDAWSLFSLADIYPRFEVDRAWEAPMSEPLEYAVEIRVDTSIEPVTWRLATDWHSDKQAAMASVGNSGPYRDLRVLARRSASKPWVVKP